jgi:fatty acid desaturase
VAEQDLEQQTAQTEVAARRRGPDPVALVIGLLTLAMAVAAFTGRLPAINFDPRWLLAGAAAVVGALLLLGSLRRR